MQSKKKQPKKMQTQKSDYKPELNKKIIMAALTVLAIAIMLSGVGFGVYCMAFNITFKVLNTNLPGVVFGVLVAYLGLRYYLMLRKLKGEIYKSTAKFSWDNFKRRKKTAKVAHN